MGPLKIFGLVLGACVLVFLLYATTRPDSFHVARSTVVQAPLSRVHALINDLHQFNTWNPYNKDPATRGEYAGPRTGPGATYHFDGGSGGKGTVRILGSAPTEVAMELHMLKPMEARNKVLFTLVPRGDATEVTWAMDGPSPYIAKLLHLVMNMDRMVGGAFETGLGELKQRAERG
ncbi:MAG: hypothetical protein JWP41_3082 [Ramlibacter sp.]|nr:hypothetical protein [Ramlibacter sp.]